MHAAVRALIILTVWPLVAFQCNHHGKEYPIAQYHRDKFIRNWTFTRLDSPSVYPPYLITIVPSVGITNDPAVTILNFLPGADSIAASIWQDPYEMSFTTDGYQTAEVKYYRGTLRYDTIGPKLNANIQVRKFDTMLGKDTMLYEFQGVAN